MKTCYYRDDISDICDHKHLTVDEIFNKISRKYPDAGKSSIYRNVECMVLSWDLRKVVWLGNKAYFEKNNGDHIHLIDNESWKIVDFKGDFKIPWLPENFKAQSSDIKIFWNFS